MTYWIEADARLVHIEGSGPVTDDEMVRCVEALRQDPQLEPDMNTLSDMRRIEVKFTSSGVTPMLDVMDISATRRTNARAAIVVTSDVAYGIGRMFEIRAEDRAEPNFRIFRSMAEARGWLGLD